MGRIIGVSSQQCKEEIVSPPVGNKYSRVPYFWRRTRINVRFCLWRGVAQLLQRKDQVRDRLHAESSKGGMMSGALIALRSLAPVIYGSTALLVLVMVFQSFAIDIVKRVHAFVLKLSKENRTGA